jgi:hypothetical protein
MGRFKPGTPKPEGSGRKAGQPNHVTVALKKLAQDYGPQSIRKLAEMAGLIEGVKPVEQSATQLGALRELLDRGYGRAVQPIDADDGEPLIVNIVRYSDVAETRQRTNQGVESASARTYYSA